MPDFMTSTPFLGVTGVIILILLIAFVASRYHVAGALGSAVVFGAFKVLRQAESTESFSLQDMVGTTGRVSVAIPANRFGTVMMSFAGASHNMTATADGEIAAGKQVKVVAVAGTNLVVEPTTVATNEGAKSDA